MAEIIISKKPLRALVVEDSELDARVLVTLLRKGGYDVTFERVETPAAMALALETRIWDVVLADHNLPEFSAPAALQLLQDKGIDLPFIIISGGIGEDIAVAAMKAGAHDYLMKGNLARLVPAVERELREAAHRAARRVAEQALRDSEMRYRLLWETATDAVLLMDTDSVIHFANPAAEIVFGYRPEDLIGKNLTLLLPERLHDSHRESFAGYLLSGVSEKRRRIMETVALKRENQAHREVLIEIAFNDMELQGKRWFVAFVRDITERKRAEQELREHEEQFRVAREIQQRLFPKSAPNLPGFDIAGASFPAEATGGDYYDYIPMVRDGLGVAIADVTGHGLGPALLVAETRAYLRIVALNRDDVGEIMTRANLVLAEDVGDNRYVTLILARIEPATRLLTYASAGHPEGYVLDATGGIKHRLKRTGIPLGFKPDTRYQTSPPIQLERGEIILLLTDGIDEAMSASDEFFGIERALEVVRAHKDQTSAEIVESIYGAVRAFCGNSAPQDDVTALVVKVL